MSVATDSDFLQGMAASSRARDAEARTRLSDAQQRSLLVVLDKAASLNLAAKGFDLIAEIKKRSPAEGELDANLASPADQAAVYADGGAAALSVLTEPEQFSGSLEDLHEVAGQSSIPVMRKDFLVSRYQVREARLAGASGVLLIAAILDADRMKAMLESAFELGMFVLMEVFDPADLDKCVPILEGFGAAVEDGRCNYLLGVNCRDLRNLQVNFGRFAEMAAYLPAEVPWVAESGLTEAQHAETAATLGYRMALVGSALMRSDNPAGTIKAFRQAGHTGLATCS
ncbi:MAG: indole-3-glycerol-phosphate synthase [Gammaproteobacteria bacterium]|jgi:indole-3-glycerol phosphate synthase|nr:indole-3-glycerol-phosphate synthase [Gammaproteobacteria bacterium]MDP6617402.1 indole-3-glycerol-phosphate synthase [Gammaproteobacteria bacterium]MDP6694649.1 indole-3-glycerol-phosphate synthase [Gammaproteobacteria bacterium]MDP7041292.1 indole-3-glycerol-phosphate synthase [Gammaproteobacteria bacterium]